MYNQDQDLNQAFFCISACLALSVQEFTRSWCVSPLLHWRQHIPSPCVWACWSDLSLWPVCPGQWHTGLSGPGPGWQRCVPVGVWQHRCGGSSFLPGSRALQTEAGRLLEASGAPGCTGPCRKARPAPLVPHLRRERETGDELKRLFAFHIFLPSLMLLCFSPLKLHL